MPTLKPLDREIHRHHGWKLRTSMISALKDTVVPILITEVTKILPGYAFAFVKDRNGKFVFVAIQGLHQDENLYINEEGKPLFTPTPRYYHTYPFGMHEVEIDGKMKATLFFDHDSGLYREEPQVDKGEKKFITDEGEIDPDIEKVLEYLNESEKWRKITQNAVDALEEAGVIEPWSPSIENPDTKRQLLKGFHKINMENLNKLNGEEMTKLQNAQGLTVAYAQLFSIYRVEMLNKLYAVKKKQEEMSQASVKNSNIDNVDAFFGLDDGEDVSFDWSKI